MHQPRLIFIQTVTEREMTRVVSFFDIKPVVFVVKNRLWASVEDYQPLLHFCAIRSAVSNI